MTTRNHWPTNASRPVGRSLREKKGAAEAAPRIRPTRPPALGRRGSGGSRRSSGLGRGGGFRVAVVVIVVVIRGRVVRLLLAAEELVEESHGSISLFRRARVVRPPSITGNEAG